MIKHAITPGNILFSCFTFWGIFFLLPGTISSQPSIIETAQKSLPAIVTVSAEVEELFKLPQAAAAIDKKTGKLLVLRNARATHLKRTGAGVIIDPSGIVVVNSHTIAHAKGITVTLYDNTRLPAHLVKIVSGHDLGFIQIAPPYPLPVIQFADSDNMQLGDTVVTVGNSELLKETISEGRIIGIGKNRRKKDNNKNDLFQININVYRGDSGGPVLDKKGRLIGLMVAGQIKKDRSSFAIPANQIKEHYKEYLASMNKVKK